MLYWTYQDNYPLLTQDGKTPYMAFQAVQLMQNAFSKGATICTATSDNDGLMTVAAIPPDGKGATLLLVNTLGAGQVTVRGIPKGKKANYNTLKSDEDKGASVTISVQKDNILLNLPGRSITVLTIQ